MSTFQDPNQFGVEGSGAAHTKHEGFDVKNLFKLVNDASASAKTKLADIKDRKSAISIGDMFEMQMLMNHLSQLSEMSTAVVSASNNAILKMASSVKG